MIDIYVVFDHPKDYPGSFVLKRQKAGKGEVIHDSTFLMISKNVESLREWLRERGLHQMDRHPDDDPVILETWI